MQVSNVANLTQAVGASTMQQLPLHSVQRPVPADRERLIRDLARALRHTTVNSKKYLSLNTTLNKIYVEEQDLDDAYRRGEHVEYAD
jgi:hypothetical protein